MKNYFLLIFILILIPVFEENNNDPDFWLKEAQNSADNNNYEEALICHKKSIALAPDDGFYYARLGQFYLLYLKDSNNAIVNYKLAIGKGFNNSWMYYQMADAYESLGNKEEAKKNIEIALYSAKNKLKSIKTIDDDINYYQKELFASYGRLIKYYNDIDDYDNALKVINEGLSIKQDSDKWIFVYQTCRTYYWLGYIAFGSQRWDDALFYFDKIIKLRGNNKAVNDKYTDLEITIDLVKKRKDLGQIRPQYTHKILVFNINETDVDMKNLEGNDVKIKSKLTEQQKKYSRISSNAFRSYIEALSGGKISVSFNTIDVNNPMKKLILDSSSDYENEDDAVTRYLDINYLGTDLSRFFYDNANYYDTYFFIWSSQDYNIANAGMEFYPVNQKGDTIKRGFIQIPGERFLYNGPYLLLHEFFHVVENIADIFPRHGMRDENRSNFPDWKGSEELDYYYWHFQNTIPQKMADMEKETGLKGYENFSFLNRYKLKK